MRHATTIVSVHERPIAVRVRRAEVEAVRGVDAGVRARLTGRRMTIGSDPSNELVLSDPAVSRFHCRLVAGDDGFRVVDRGSANGTYVNGTRVREAYVDDGAKLRLGQTDLVVRFGETESEIELSTEDYFGGAVGRSVRMRELFAAVRRAAPSEATVLLQGETGTGKDVLARGIHDHSGRRGPFVVFDCGAVTPTLVESALFGHVRGAFTGADADRPGVFEQAHTGTLFLDEIGELPLELQPKLLRALETGTVTRVGATQPVAVDVRIVAATNRDLREEVESGRFRSDLFFRLAVIPLEVPPLRERAEDIPLLCAHFLRDVIGAGKWLEPHLDEAFGALGKQRWPGNVRELRNVLERAVAMADPAELAGDGFARLVALRSSIAQTMHARPPLKLAREQFDREYLRDVLDAAGGDVKAAAQAADVHQKSFERLLRRYGVARA